jgi:hypothetical protein
MDPWTSQKLPITPELQYMLKLRVKWRHCVSRISIRGIFFFAFLKFDKLFLFSPYTQKISLENRQDLPRFLNIIANIASTIILRNFKFFNGILKKILGNSRYVLNREKKQ